MKLEEYVEIKRSPIHGTGVFALKAFAPGEIVLQWNISQLITEKELELLPVGERQYTHPFDEDKIIVVQSPERFVNHGCDNNTIIRNFCDVATRHILPGEEITGDYSSDGGGKKFICTCGSENCRGRIG